MKEKINGGGQKRGGVAKCNTALENIFLKQYKSHRHDAA